MHKREGVQDAYTGKLFFLEDYIVYVTERNLIEKNLHSSEMKYHALFESSQEAIFLMLGDTFVDCNYATFKLFECTPKDIIGSTPYQFSPEYQPGDEFSYEKAINYIRRAFNGKILRFEWTHRTLNVKLFKCEVTLNRFFIGSTLYLVAIVGDIRENKLKSKSFLN